MSCLAVLTRYSAGFSLRYFATAAVQYLSMKMPPIDNGEDPTISSIDDTKTQEKRFKSFAVIDLETSNLPERNFNRVGITELSILAFAVKEIPNNLEVKETVGNNEENPGKNQENKGNSEENLGNSEENKETGARLPDLPRVLHKLTLVMNPGMMIHPEAEKITGLNNFMLEHESLFNDNAIDTLIGFLKHLQQPVCLVAHNGHRFDFPIVKSMLNKKNRTLPAGIYCLDSMRAFHDIDVIRSSDANNETLVDPEPAGDVSPTLKDNPTVARQTSQTSIDVETIFESHPISQTEWVDLENTMKELEKTHPDSAAVMQKLNETTPKRPTARTNSNGASAYKNPNGRNSESHNKINKLVTPRSKNLKSRRALFCDSSTEKQRIFPPRNLYKLNNIFLRMFKRAPINSHDAENDVKTLAHLILHYGEDFQKYAEQHAILFEDMPSLREIRL